MDDLKPADNQSSYLLLNWCLLMKLNQICNFESRYVKDLYLRSQPKGLECDNGCNEQLHLTAILLMKLGTQLIEACQ